MLPPEHAIEAALETLSPGQFQLLAESYAEIELASRFGRQLVQGRDSRARTVTGWPDSYALMDDGRIDALEATTDSQNWTRHLDQDIAKASQLPAPGIGGFAFVTLGRTPRPATLSKRRKRLRELGVEERNQTFVFRQDLIKSLRSGQFARVWLTQLGLSVSSVPFVELSVAAIYGDSTPGHFMPTKREYETGQVQTPSIARSIEANLSKSGFALVNGRGAAGKTSLAGCLGWRRLKLGQPVYYLDLADPEARGMETTRRGSEILDERGDTRVLFIVDNVHQNESTAAELYRHWHLGSTGAHLLFLGRDAEHRGATRGIAPPLSSLPGTPFGLVADRDAMRAVFNRLRRKKTLGTVDVAIPNGVLKRWLRVFGGDLIAFAAAIADTEVGPPNWRVDPGDAKSYLHDRYLSGLSKGEQEALCLVADRSALELFTSVDLVDPALVTAALQDGVLERRDGELRTIHPGVGELILSAAGASIGDFAAAVSIDEGATDESFVASVVAARRLARRKRRGRARSILKAWIGANKALIDIVAVMGGGSFSERIALLELILGSEAVVSGLRDEPDAVASFVLSASLEEVTSLGTALRSKARVIKSSLQWSMKDLVEAEQVPVARLAAEARDQSAELPLILRNVHSVSPDLYDAMLQELAVNGALTSLVQSTRGLRKRSWAELVTAAACSESFESALIHAIQANPSAATRLLIYKGIGSVLIDATAEVPSVRLALIDHIRSATFSTEARTLLLASGPKRCAAIIEMAARFDPGLCVAFNALADDEERVIGAVLEWRAGPKALRRVLSATSDSCPDLDRVIRVTLLNAGRVW